MPTYTLNIDFSNADVKTQLSADQKLVFIKTMAGGEAASVAWVTFSPMMQNTVSWTEDYTLYASTTGEHAASPQVLEWQPAPEGVNPAAQTAGLSFALQTQVEGETVLIPLQGAVVPEAGAAGSLSWQPGAGDLLLTTAD